VIAGWVKADGSIAAGDGFTVSHPSTGSYIMSFPPGFRCITGTSTMFGGAAWAVVMVLTDRTMQVNVYTPAQALADGQFTFIAVGVQQ
jgi:hypothetical protein